MRILESQSNETPGKARAIIVDKDETVVVMDYDGCLMFPGGKLDKGEDSRAAAIREVKEETGIEANNAEKLFTFQLTAENYPERDGTITERRLVEVDYFLSKIANIELGQRELTEKEKLGNLVLRQVKLDELLDFVDVHETDNPRWPYFQEEMTTVVGRLLQILAQTGQDDGK